MASAPQPANQPARRRSRRRNLGERLPLGERLLLVSRHVTHFPARLKELWSQFRLEARASYSLYSREIEAAKGGTHKGRLWWAKQFFRAVIDKLSPARRVVLLIALYVLFFPTEISWSTAHGVHVFSLDPRLGGLLLFLLLSLEIADRVLMKRDLQIAREIQTWLLPAKPPEVPGVEIAFDTRPANTVAGDYYDVIPRPLAADSAEPTYLIAVADVVGKSIPAALLMASLQTSLKILTATPAPFERLVGAMNDYACSNSQGGLRFTTAFFAEYEPATRALTYINAGHNWPILRSQSGRIAYLDRGGLPLGVESKVAYETGSAVIEQGDWLVIYTDGVVEAVNEEGTEYGVNRLIAVLNAGADSSPAQMLARIMADLDVFVGSQPQHDDITCLLMKAV
jgi:serine phosphatase RsbU (regulator of sigma subunit)